MGCWYKKSPRLRKYTGTVRSVLDFGAFVDIGAESDGLLHISRISKEFDGLDSATGVVWVVKCTHSLHGLFLC